MNLQEFPCPDQVLFALQVWNVTYSCVTSGSLLHCAVRSRLQRQHGWIEWSIVRRLHALIIRTKHVMNIREKYIKLSVLSLPRWRWGINFIDYSCLKSNLQLYPPFVRPCLACVFVPRNALDVISVAPFLYNSHSRLSLIDLRFIALIKCVVIRCKHLFKGKKAQKHEI